MWCGLHMQTQNRLMSLSTSGEVRGIDSGKWEQNQRSVELFENNNSKFGIGRVVYIHLLWYCYADSMTFLKTLS